MNKQAVLCVPRLRLEQVFGGTIPLGFSVSRQMFALAAGTYITEGKFLARAVVEDDPTILQAIVYGVVSDGRRVLGLWRKERHNETGKFKETRHNGLIGLAAGGHLEPSANFGKEDFFDREILREFSEELNFSAPPRPLPAGIIMYEETALDRVHLGLIYKVLTHEKEVGLAEDNDEYDRCRFLRPDELSPLRERMEGWGKMITDAIISGEFNLDG